MRTITANSTAADCTVRYAQAEDREAIVRLAQLDSQREPTGTLLVAQCEGGILAALPLEGGDPIANPFVRTVELVELLRVRATQLGTAPDRARKGLRSHAIRRRAAAAIAPS